MRLKRKLPKNIHPGYADYLDPEPVKSAAHKTLVGQSFIVRIAPYFLAAAVSLQVALAYQFYQAKEALVASSTERLDNMEERFLKISVVLRFLLDKTKDGLKPEATLNTEPSLELPPQGNDLPLAKVSAQRLNLRAGPGTNHAPIMTVSLGTILVVEDTSQGIWVRVVAPNGARAYAQKDQLTFATEER